MFKGAVTNIFFDLDHTLWDFEKNSALTFERIFGQNAIDVSLEEFLAAYVPINLEYWKLYREAKVTKEELRFQRLRKAFDAISLMVSDSTVHQLSDAYVDNLSNFDHVFPGTKEVLEYLQSKYRLHIITNGFEEIQEKKMKKSKIHHFFEIIVNSEMAGVKKPHPKIFELALDMANTMPEKSLMVGDSLEADILGAHNAGLQTLHFDSHNGPAHDICPIIHSLDEIKNFL